MELEPELELEQQQPQAQKQLPALRGQQELQALAVPAAMSRAYPRSSARRSQLVQPQEQQEQLPQLPEQAEASGQPTHWTPFPFCLRI